MAYIASCCGVWAQGYCEFIQACRAGRDEPVAGLNTNEFILISQSFRYWWRALRSIYECVSRSTKGTSFRSAMFAWRRCAHYSLDTVYQNETAIGRASAARYQRMVFCYSIAFVMILNSMTIAPICDQWPSETSTLVP